MVDDEFGRTVRARLVASTAPTASTPAPGAAEPAAAGRTIPDDRIFEPPFLGTKVIKGIALAGISEYINETAIFRNQWGFRPEAGESDVDFKTRIRPTLRDEMAKATGAGILVPQVAYGYFAVNGDGNELVVWSDASRTSELARFSYPRQSEGEHLCIADFFRAYNQGASEADFAAFSIVTMGKLVSDRAAELFAENRYQEYLLVHGLGVEMTEALAEMWHRRIREEWGFAAEDGPSLAGLFRQQYRGGRYSWGYPACPDLEDNAKVAELLGAHRIGVECGEDTSWQYHPEQTTSAIICHHPQAKYFVAR